MFSTKSLIPILCIIPVLMSSCYSYPRGKSLQNRIESQQRIDGHKAHLDLEQAYRAYSNGMFEKAMKLAEQARQRTPSDPRSYMLLARICLEEGRLEACDRLLGEVIKLDDGIPDSFGESRLTEMGVPNCFLEARQTEDRHDLGDGTPDSLRRSFQS